MAYQPISQPNVPPTAPPQYGSTGNPNIIRAQPTAAGTAVHVYDTKKVNSNGALVLSVIVAIICGLASPVTLCCSIPAIIFAVMSSDGPNMEQRASQVRVSFILAIVALVFGLVANTIVIIIILI